MRKLIRFRCNSRFRFAVLFLIVTGFGAPALAMECAPFEVQSDNWQRGVYPKGDPIIGTKRAGTRRLFDDTGQEIGLYTYVGVVVEVGTGGETIMNVTRTFSFEDGILTGVGVTAHPDVIDTLVQPDRIYTVVTGGSGAFRGAHGTIEMKTPQQDGKRAVSFDISCE
jgi:hypothetical protein